MQFILANFKISFRKKQARVTPVFKSGDKSDVYNYRPISVLPVVSKMYLTERNIFRSKHSINTTLLDVSDHILKNMNDGKATTVIFLDLKKAFDTVNHGQLIKKLKHIGIKFELVYLLSLK